MALAYWREIQRWLFTQESFITFQHFIILISIYISINIHMNITGWYALIWPWIWMLSDFEFTFYALKPENLAFYNSKRYKLPVSGLVDALQPLLWIKVIETLEIPSLLTLIWHF